MSLGPTVPPRPATEWLESLLPVSEHRRLETRLPAGTIIHRCGSPSRGIFFVKSGTIEISLPDANGGANSMFQVGPGGAVGLLAALEGKPSETNAIVLTPVIGYFVPVPLLRSWLERDPAHYLPLAQMLSEWNENAVRVLRAGRMQPRASAPRKRDPRHTNG